MNRCAAFAFIPVLILLAAICPLRAQDTAAWADFQQKAAAWRALPVKPALSEEVRRERVLAENAVKEKEFKSALDHYESGLKINPLWPEGHFNAALLYAELEGYYEAIWHMRAYLELVPDAPDAQGARDQLIIWQDKLWIDPATKLMWTRQDNIVENWGQGNNYCQSLGGHSSWRLPTIDELAGIYDPTNDSVVWGTSHYHIKGGIKLRSFWVWSSSRSSGKPWCFNFGNGKRISSDTCTQLVLCVRRSGE